MANLKDNRLSKIIKLSSQAFRRYRWHIAGLTFLSFLAGFLEGVGINALVPLLSFVLNQQQADDFISRTIESFFSFLGISFQIKYLLAFIILLFVSRALISIVLNYIKARITVDYQEKTRNLLLEKILKASWPHLLTKKLGHLETILMVNVEQSGNLLQQIANFITLATSLLIYIVVALNISAVYTSIALALGGVIFLIFKPLIYKSKMISVQTERLNRRISHHIGENILGLKNIKSMVIGHQVAAKAAGYFRELKRLKLKSTLFKNLSNVFVQPLGIIFICLIFAFSYKSPDFNFAALAAIIYLIEKIFVYIQQIQKNLHSLNECVPFLQSVLNYQFQAGKNKEKDFGSKPFKFQERLKFENLSFSYYSETPVLKEVSFEIKKGEMIGLIGPSGVGKTTLVDLILRLLKPTAGRIILDGRDISEIKLDDWRWNIGYVSQDIFLINDTIANNIRFYHSGISETQLVEAAKMANIYNFIESCPEKLQTIIGERGLRLSAGQRQRLVIARILARRPNILLLDEATSSLDNESELRIQEVIQKFRGEITVFVIAHRLSTVTDVDKLLVLEKGRIIEQGNPRELLKDKNSKFFEIYNLRG